MINVAELITDRDFAQPEGISITRYTNSIVNHEVVEVPQDLVVQGVLIALDANTDEMLAEADRNVETITILTHDRLMTVGEDKLTGISYGADIVHYRGSDYKVQSCQDLTQYGYCRSKAIKIEQDEM